MCVFPKARRSDNDNYSELRVCVKGEVDVTNGPYSLCGKATLMTKKK